MPDTGAKWSLRADSPALRRPLLDAAAAASAVDGPDAGGGGGDEDAGGDGDDDGRGGDHDDGGANDDDDDDEGGGLARRAHLPLVHQGLALFNAIMHADTSKAHKSKLCCASSELLYLGGRKAVSTAKIRPLEEKRRGRARPAAAAAADAGRRDRGGRR